MTDFYLLKARGEPLPIGHSLELYACRHVVTLKEAGTTVGHASF